jgi:alkanesulfonate monooxygenase SsuD/methylene tetrahydromethanopterin reductase-like flavin-dependent oxidoreductase (luciferase family)
VGIAFGERWARFDEAFRLVRALLTGGTPPPAGKFYTGGTELSPLPERAPEVWFGSWGSDRRFAAMATTADGWFASGYNATPHRYTEIRTRLDAHLRAAGRQPETFSDAVATTWFYSTESPREAEYILNDVLAPALDRDPQQLAHLPIGSPEHCARVLADYAAAGAREMLIWPVRDSRAQLERCMTAAPPPR